MPTYLTGPPFKLSNDRFYAEQKGYQILYADSNSPIQRLNGLPPIQNIHGPDIIALNPQTGKVVIIEAKGYLNDLHLGRGNIVQDLKLGRPTAVETTQNSFEWLTNDADRYLEVLREAADPQIRQAANEIQKILNGGSYETIIVAAGNNPQLGAKMDVALEQLNTKTTSVEIVKLAWR